MLVCLPVEAAHQRRPGQACDRFDVLACDLCLHASISFTYAHCPCLQRPVDEGLYLIIVALAGIPGQNGEYMLVSPSPSAAPSPMGVTKPSPNPGIPSPAPTAVAQDAVAPDRAVDGRGGGSGLGLGFVTPITSPRGEPSAPRPMLSGSPAALARAAEVRLT